MRKGYLIIGLFWNIYDLEVPFPVQVSAAVSGANYYGSCGFLSIDWYVVLSDINHSYFDPLDVSQNWISRSLIREA